MDEHQIAVLTRLCGLQRCVPDASKVRDDTILGDDAISWALWREAVHYSTAMHCNAHSAHEEMQQAIRLRQHIVTFAAYCIRSRQQIPTELQRQCMVQTQVSVSDC